MLRCNAESISIIINEHMTEVRQYLESLDLPVPLHLVVKTTPSSMHSFYELSPYLDGPSSNFILTTVDTIFREDEFADYVRTFQRLTVEETCDGLMGVTPYIDDEKPLYVETVGQGSNEWPRITNFLDACAHPHYISGGIYGLTPRAIDTLNACIERGESRMRNFQRALIRDGLQLRAYCFSKVLDIDHASDIQKAEEFLKGGR
jgi:NDP-sugar pyrophosphorylase family protein